MKSLRIITCEYCSGQDLNKAVPEARQFPNAARVLLFRRCVHPIKRDMEQHGREYSGKGR